MVEKTLESPLDCKEIKPVNSKENQSWIFIGRIEAEAPILLPPDAKNWLIGKDPDAGKHWRWEEKGMTADEMVGWHHRLYGHEFEQAQGVGGGQGSLVCWGRKESDITEWLNWISSKQKNFKDKQCQCLGCYTALQFWKILPWGKLDEEYKGSPCIISYVNLQLLLNKHGGEASTCQCRRDRFDPLSGKIPHALEQLSLCTATIEPVL